MFHLNIYLENSKFFVLYNLVQNRISLMMYMLVNGLLPDIMSDLCIVNNEVHNHFTRQSHFYLLRREEIMYLSNASITLVSEFGIP